MQVKTNQVKELRTSHSNNATLKQEKSQWFFFYILRFWVPKLIYPWPWYMWNVLHSVYLRNIQCNLQIICGWSDSVYLFVWNVVVHLYIYRWLGYLSLLLFDVLICLLVLFGLIRNSRGTLIGYVTWHHTQACSYWTVKIISRLSILSVKTVFCMSCWWAESGHERLVFVCPSECVCWVFWRWSSAGGLSAWNWLSLL